MTDDLTAYDIEVLKAMAGEPNDAGPWGAGMGAAVEFLYGCGYATKEMRDDGMHYLITDKGRAALRAHAEVKE